MRITITRNDERRGPTTRTLEFERENLSMTEIIGALDGLLRQSWPEDMRRRTLNLSNRTDQGRDREVVQPNRVSRAGRPTWDYAEEDEETIPGHVIREAITRVERNLNASTGEPMSNDSITDLTAYEHTPTRTGRLGSTTPAHPTWPMPPRAVNEVPDDGTL